MYYILTTIFKWGNIRSLLSFLVIETDNEDIGCAIGTEDTLEDDGKTVKTMAHDTILEAQPGLVKVNELCKYSMWNHIN